MHRKRELDGEDKGAMAVIKKPVILDNNLRPMGTIEPTTMQLTEKEGMPSSCAVSTAEDAPRLGTWVRVWSPQGDRGVFVVRTASRDFVTGEASMTMDHAIGLLADDVIFEELTPETMTGQKGATKIGAADCIRKLLEHQATPRWVLGRCDFEDEQGWSFSTCTIYAALTGMMGALEDWAWTFDMDTLPWKLNVVRKSKETACEMRSTRNLSTISTTVDKSGMCTRIYPQGAAGLTIEGVNDNVPFLERNVEFWGRVARVENEGSIEDAALLKAWAERMLDKLAQPLVTVSVSGLELSEATGEPLDRLTVGTMCRVPLPEYGTVITERITQLQWPDMLNAPQRVSITMANSPQTTQGVLAKLQKSGGGGGGGGTTMKEEKNIYTIFNQTDEAITSMAVAKRHMQTAWAKQVITADSIDNVVTRYEYDDAGDLLESHHTEILQTADWIKTTGKAIFDDLYSNTGKFESLTSGSTTATSIIATTLRAASNFVYHNSNLALIDVLIDGVRYHFLGYRG